MHTLNLAAVQLHINQQNINIHNIDGVFFPLDCVLWLFLFYIFVCYNRDSALPPVDWTWGGVEWLKRTQK